MLAQDSTPGKEGQGEGALLLAAVAFFLAVGSIFPVRDTDVFLHLAAGKVMVEEGRILRRDPFSFTAPGEPWVAFEWGFEVVAYLLWRLGGAALLILAKYGVLVATFWVLHRAARARGADLRVTAVWLFLWTWLATIVLYCRPHIVSYFLIALLHLVLAAWRRGRDLPLLALPPVFALWANLHPGFIAGYAFLLLGGLAEAATRDRGGRLRLAAAVAAAAPATLLNPFGLDAWRAPLRITSSAYLMATIDEWAPVWTRLSFPDVREFLAWVAVTPLLLIAAGRGHRRGLLPCAFFALLAAKTSRNIPLFGLVALPYLAAATTSLGGRLLRGGGLRHERRALASLAIAAVVLAAAVYGLAAGLPFTRGRVFAFGVEPSKIPVGALDFMEKNGIHGRVLNSYAFGGYIAWRQYPRSRVAMDGRNELYDEDRVRRHVDTLRDLTAFERFAAAHDVDLVLLGPGDAGLWPYIAQSPGWNPVYADTTARVALRNRAAEPVPR